jgi:hemolysin D
MSMRPISVVIATISLLFSCLLGWSLLAELDIVATADGKLVPQTLVKVVQPAEAGVVRALHVKEGDHVRAGQLIARLDTTVSSAERDSSATELAMNRLQERRILTELSARPLMAQEGDDTNAFAQVLNQYLSNRQAQEQAVQQEIALLEKTRHERASAIQMLAKLERTLPAMLKASGAYAELERTGFISPVAASEKQREAIEREAEREAQSLAVEALGKAVTAQQKRVRQLEAAYHSRLHKELVDTRLRIVQLQGILSKSVYRDGLMELRAPQDGIIKEMALATVGGVVQPGSVIATLVPEAEQLFADISIANADIGFVQAGQPVKLKVVAYPFQKYGLMDGSIATVGPDAAQPNGAAGAPEPARYKARVALKGQALKDPAGIDLALAPGMAVIAEVGLGKRNVLEYLLAPLKRVGHEAARER